MPYFDVNDVCFSDDGKKLLKSPTNVCGSYKIPFGVETIAAYSFKGCVSITEIVLPSTINTIEEGAFDGAKAITKLIYEGSLEQWLKVVHIGYINTPHDLYINGELIEKVIIPDDCTIIPSHAFYYARSLKSVIFHDKIKEIDESAFNKSGIKGQIVLPPQLRTIGKYAFLSCAEVEIFKIPTTVDYIGAGAFRYCSGVKRYEISDENPNYACFTADLYRKDYSELLAIAYRLHFGPKYNVNVEALPDFIFSDMRESITTISIGDNIKRIGKHAFDNYKGKVEISDAKAPLLEGLGIPKERIIVVHDFESDFAKRNSIIDYISNNPYRILALPSGASIHEIEESYSKLKTVLKSNVQRSTLRTISIPSLKDVIITDNVLDRAYHALNNVIQRVIYSLFWFYSTTEKQQKAFNTLLNGDLDSACDLYYEEIDYDTVQNRYLLPLLQGSFTTAIDDLLSFVCDLSDEEIINKVNELIVDAPIVRAIDVRSGIVHFLEENFDIKTLFSYIEQSVYSIDLICKYSENGNKEKIDIDDDCWIKAKSDTKKLLDYITKFGNKGKHSAEANALLNSLANKDNELWGKCKVMADYQKYLNTSPLKMHKKEAENKIAEIKEKTKWVSIVNFMLFVTAIILIIKLITT